MPLQQSKFKLFYSIPSLHSFLTVYFLQCLVALQGKYYPGPGGQRFCSVCVDIINRPQTAPTQPAAPAATRSVNPNPPCRKCKVPLSGSIIECDGFKFHAPVSIFLSFSMPLLLTTIE